MLSQSSSRAEGGLSQIAQGILDISDEVDFVPLLSPTNQSFRYNSSLEAKQVLADFLVEGGWDDRRGEFKLIADRRSPGGRHLRYQQHCGDIPLAHRFLKLNLIGEIANVQGSFDADIDCSSFSKLSPARAQISSSQVASWFTTNLLIRESGRTVIIDIGEGPELVIESKVTTSSGDWTMYSDRGVELRHVESNTSRKRSSTEKRSASDVRRLTLDERELSYFGKDEGHARKNSSASDFGHSTAGIKEVGTPVNDKRQTIDGSGLVFNPDPLGSSGREYGGQMVDNEDADTDSLNLERKLVSLPNITQGNDGLYRLIGPWIEIRGEDATGRVTYIPPAESDPNDFQYTREDDFFEAVNVYYHINQSQEYLESLGFTDLQRGPIKANPLDGIFDQSFYLFSSNFMTFGGGGVDDAEDASIIWHEYAHAIMESASPGLYSGNDGLALHEGWADYWAASYQRSLHEQGILKRDDWFRVLRWDGNTLSNQSRTLNITEARYPNWLERGYGRHREGLIWGTTLLEIYTELGREVTDRLHLQANYMLEFPLTMPAAARALVLADVALYDGDHAETLISILSEKGFVNAGEFGPILSHDELGDREELSASLDFELDARSMISAVDRVVVRVSQEDNVFVEQELTHLADSDLFATSLSHTFQPGLVQYYFLATDMDGRMATLPLTAPDSLFEFHLGPDIEPPSIEHTPASALSITNWPPQIRVSVQDNIGVASVIVDYALQRLGDTIKDGNFNLLPSAENDTEFFASLPLLAGEVQSEDVFSYRIGAIDSSENANQKIEPSLDSSPFSSSIAGSNVFYIFGPNSPLLGFEGSWEFGRPEFGELRQSADFFSFGTEIDESYSDIAGLSELKIGPIDLVGFPKAHLDLRHFYDTEFTPSRNVDSTGGHFLWDGGVVQSSIDDGATWQTLEPRNGYSGIIQGEFQNALRDSAAFGGDSYGWQRDVFPLPESENLSIRFLFSTDFGNRSQSLNYDGWYIDRIQILNNVPEDGTAPSADAYGDPPLLFDIKDDYEDPVFVVMARDDFGVDSVIVDYQIQRGNAITRASQRIHGLGAFRDNYFEILDLHDNPLSAGDEIRFKIRAVDESGNTQIVPDDGFFEYRYKLIARSDQLNQASSSGSWMRNAQGGWHLSPFRDSGKASSLVLPPFTLASNSDSLVLELRHEYNLNDGAGGQLSVSIDGGAKWRILDPVDAYPGLLSNIDGGVWTGPNENEVVARQDFFDLREFAEETIQVRLLFRSNRGVSTQEFWSVNSIVLSQHSLDDELDIPRELRLFPNFPDPASTQSTFAYTIDETDFYNLSLFDTSGRRVRLLLKKKLDPGSFQTSVELAELSSGTYFLVLESEDRGIRKTESLTIIR